MAKLKGLGELQKKIAAMAARAKALDGRQVVVPAGQLKDVKRKLSEHILHGTKLPIETPRTPSAPAPAPSSNALAAPSSPPKAFISHNRANKAEAEALARELRNNGVDAWFDKWEIGPGDSLVGKINEGLATAQLFVILLSPEALKSRWVGAELDFGVVARINETAKVVPVIVTACEVPPLLQATKYLNWSTGLEDVVRDLADVAHGRWVTRKPLVVVPAGAPATSPAPEVSAYAFEVIKRLLPLALESSTVSVVSGGLVEGLTISAEQFKDALEELEEARCISVSWSFGSENELDLGVVQPKPELLMVAHRGGLIDFDPDDDVRKVLVKVVSEGSVVGEELRNLGLSVERINWAAEAIDEQGLADVASVMGDDFTFVEISATRATKKWVAAL